MITHAEESILTPINLAYRRGNLETKENGIIYSVFYLPILQYRKLIQIL